MRNEPDPHAGRQRGKVPRLSFLTGDVGHMGGGEVGPNGGVDEVPDDVRRRVEDAAGLLDLWLHFHFGHARLKRDHLPRKRS